MDQRLAKSVINLPPEIVYVYVNHVGAGVKREIPDMLNDHRTADSAPRIAHEVFEQGEFFGRKFDAPSGPLYSAFDSVEFEIIHRQRRFRGQMAPTQQRPDACREFRERKRLAHIVVRSEI